MQPEDLYAGETLLLSKNANSVISINDFGLNRLGVKMHGVFVPCDQLMGVIGFKGKEALGGRLHVTNYRVYFKAHAINRVRGSFSILLPIIETVRDTSRFISKKVEIACGTQTFEFVVWGVPELIATINSAQRELNIEQQKQLKECIVSAPEKLGNGLHAFKKMERLFEGMPEMADNVKDLVTDPISLANVLTVIELWKKISAKEAAG